GWAYSRSIRSRTRRSSARSRSRCCAAVRVFFFPPLHVLARRAVRVARVTGWSCGGSWPVVWCETCAAARGRAARPCGVRFAGPRGLAGTSSDVEAHVLGLQELVDSHEPTFSAEPGLLDTAERGGRVGDHSLVQAHHAGLE